VRKALLLRLLHAPEISVLFRYSWILVDGLLNEDSLPLTHRTAQVQIGLRRSDKRDRITEIRDGQNHLGPLGSVVDVEEFEGPKDGLVFTAGAAALFPLNRDGRARDYAKRVAKRLLQDLRGDRAMRKFELALRASQHPTGHVSACPSSSGLMRRGRKGRE
jgi:hypothetical protein